MTVHRLSLTIFAALAACAFATSAQGFNLSGINYGAQQWDRAQQQGRRVWPYYNQPSASSYRSGNVSVGGFGGGGVGGAVVSGGGYRSSPRAVRRWRR
jgi:hypothetical protein